jgi:hypothetical protein
MDHIADLSGIIPSLTSLGRPGKPTRWVESVWLSEFSDAYKCKIFAFLEGIRVEYQYAKSNYIMIYHVLGSDYVDFALRGMGDGTII